MSTSHRPADIARRSAKALRARPRDAFRRETFALPREQAREKAREIFRRFPKAAYMTEMARASRRSHRIHQATAAQRRLTQPACRLLPRSRCRRDQIVLEERRAH